MRTPGRGLYWGCAVDYAGPIRALVKSGTIAREESTTASPRNGPG
jgi:hypothetical protein